MQSKYSCTGVALTDFVNWVAKNLVVGAFLYIFAYAICAVICIPGTVLTIGAGIAFTAATNDVGLGIFIGSITVFLAQHWAPRLLSSLEDTYCVT